MVYFQDRIKMPCTVGDIFRMPLYGLRSFIFQTVGLAAGGPQGRVGGAAEGADLPLELLLICTCGSYNTTSPQFLHLSEHPQLFF